MAIVVAGRARYPEQDDDGSADDARGIEQVA
jgi:hypothetical protein